MNIRIITASAGSGKTYRLARELDEALAAGRARPDGIVATTFTKEAAAELVERARSRLLAAGRGREAHQLLAGRIGTVNAVCGALVGEFAFELGLSPALRVLDEAAAELEQKRALAAVVGDGDAERLDDYRARFELNLDWHLEVRTIIAAARANGLDATGLADSAERSIAALEGCLPPPAPDGDALDAGLRDALARGLALVDPADATKGTREYVELLSAARDDLARGRLRWGDWAKLCKELPTKRSLAAATPVHAAARRHLEHPRLRAELSGLIRALFRVAAAGLAAYQAHKRERGVIDFVDQEALALELLRRPDVRAALAGQIDLVLVDEFQDTSPLQLAIFLELAGLARESVWVGDQKQAIYGFRGTDPALMDAVIESLTATSTDPELVDQAVAALGRTGVTETLRVSFRSRPELVALTSDLFAAAFAPLGIPEERTRLEPERPDEPPGLGAIVARWSLGRGEDRAAAVAAGVRELVARAPRVRDRAGGGARPALARDVAVLCRTNAQCQEVAEALADLGVRAVVPRLRLLDTAEGRLLLAGLRLWIDPRDLLAMAEIARLTTFAGDLDALVARVLAERERLAEDPTVAAILAARAAAPDVDVVGCVEAVIDAAGARALCAAWGNAAQRTANLDALRAHAVEYARETEAARDAPTAAGLVRALEEMTATWGWKASRGDSQALLGGDDAVTVSTWHRAKGREWPLVVLFGLERLAEPSPWGLTAVSEVALDVARPLAGRWLRYWPNPYTTGNQGGPVRDALENSAAFAEMAARARKEALRLTYVGWTRARDRVILAAEEGKLTSGLLGTLGSLFAEPAPSGTTWAGRRVAVEVTRLAAAAPASAPLEAGAITAARPAATAYPPARALPSAAAPVPCVVGAPVQLGPRLALRGAADMERVGSAVHAFLAADGALDEAERVSVAEALLARHGVAGALDPAEVAAAGARLGAWLAAQGARRLFREWPLAARLAGGTVLAGAADLVAHGDGGWIVVDHKTFPGALDAALARVPAYSGQLAAYAGALAAATGERVASTWIHLPVLGAIVEVSW